MNTEQKKVLRKIIYAVETGDQVYGCQNYNDFTEAYTNSSTEHAITIGAGQWYATEAQTLLKRIHDADTTLWDRLDTADVWGDIRTEDWSCYNISSVCQKAKCIVNLISTNSGIRCQDDLMDEQLSAYVREAERFGVIDPAGQAMCANFRHQGGQGAVTRILAKTSKPYTLDGLYRACQSDTGNQVGAYKARQRFVYKALKEHFPEGEDNMTKTEKAIQWMEDLARDNSHGYDQDNRWGVDYDCSSGVITAWETAGVPVKTKGATYTGNMYDVFIACGFEDVTASVNLSNGSGMVRGDVLLNHVHHVAMYCGDGKEVEASINEMGTAHGGRPGDQTGKEILIRPYRNYPWDCVLRYKDSGESAVESNGSGNADAEKMNTVNYIARISKDTKCYVSPGGDQAKLFPQIKKDAVVDVMKYTKKDSKGKTWYFIRIPHPTEGFVFEFVPSGSFRHLK